MNDSILSDDQVEAIRKKEVARQKDAERKRFERKNKREAKQAAKEAAKLAKDGRVPHIPVKLWWETNRKTLTESQKAELEARQSAVLDMFYWAQQVIDGKYTLTPDDPDYVSLQDGVDLIRNDIEKFGVTTYFYQTAMFIHELREDPTFIDIVKRTGHPIFFGYNPTEISLRFGYLTALPGEISTHPKLPCVRRPLTCSECGFTDDTKSQTTREYFCAACAEKRRIVTAASWSRVNDWLLQKQASKAFPNVNTIYGSNGAYKSQGEI